MMTSSKDLQGQTQQQRSESFDILFIGFGVTSLASAISLCENHTISDLNIAFFERQERSRWRPCVKLPGHQMRTSFMNDLVTSENPRSHFTFLNYLQTTGQLITFTNVSQMRPSRNLFHGYLEWCAKSFEPNVRYGIEVVAVEPVQKGDGLVECWSVISQDVQTGQRSKMTAKKVICAVGLQPKIPAILSQPSLRDSVVHSSECAEALDDFSKKPINKSFAILGGGQHAAEAFEYLQDIRGDHTVTLILDDSFLRPFADTPFSKDILKSSSSRLPPELRRRHDLGARTSSAHSTTDLHLLERIYEFQYAQSLSRSGPTPPRFQILSSHNLSHAERHPSGKIQLHLIDTSDHRSPTPRTQPCPTLFDTVIVATGYERTEFQRILTPIRSIVEQGAISVNRNYSVNFKKRTVAEDVGLWVAGSLDGEDDIDDAIFEILAERSRVLVKDVMERKVRQDGEGKKGDAAVQARL